MTLVILHNVTLKTNEQRCWMLFISSSIVPMIQFLAWFFIVLMFDFVSRPKTHIPGVSSKRSKQTHPSLQQMNAEAGALMPKSHFHQSAEDTRTSMDFADDLEADRFFHISFMHLWSVQIILQWLEGDLRIWKGVLKQTSSSARSGTGRSSAGH